MSIHEYQTGRQFHVWQHVSGTVRVYRGVFQARTASEAGCMAANRHGGTVLVKSAKYGATVARV